MNRTAIKFAAVGSVLASMAVGVVHWRSAKNPDGVANAATDAPDPAVPKKASSADAADAPPSSFDRLSAPRILPANPAARPLNSSPRDPFQGARAAYDVPADSADDATTRKDPFAGQSASRQSNRTDRSNSLRSTRRTAYATDADADNSAADDTSDGATASDASANEPLPAAAADADADPAPAADLFGVRPPAGSAYGATASDDSATESTPPASTLKGAPNSNSKGGKTPASSTGKAAPRTAAPATKSAASATKLAAVGAQGASTASKTASTLASQAKSADPFQSPAAGAAAVGAAAAGKAARKGPAPLPADLSEDEQPLGASALAPTSSVDAADDRGPASAPRSFHPEAADPLDADLDPAKSALSGAPLSSATAPSSLGAPGAGRPGPRALEGVQTPQLTLEKSAPEEMQVGKPARLTVRLRNSGAAPAHDVQLRDLVPEGAQLVSTNPEAFSTPQGELSWSLGTLKPGDETTVEIEVLPIAEGEMGSVAAVSFRAEATARSRVTKPELTLQVAAAKQVMIGDNVTLAIKIANPGTGPATGVILEERVPDGLKHTAGAELEFDVGTLKPGETKSLDLTLTAAQAGQIVNQLTARGDANLRADAQAEIEVIAPALRISMEGPSRRYLERQATYTVSISNPGTAPAKDVELVTQLPKGLKFVKANNSGQYDAQTHSVLWSLEELPPQEKGTVSLTALPIEAGEQRLRVAGRAAQGLSDEKEQIVVVEGLAAILFEVADVADPIEVNGETTYEIRITNQGSKGAENLRLAAILPPELKYLKAEGPSQHQVDGQKIIFEPLARLAAKADTAYRITAKGEQAGDVRMKVQLLTDDMKQPVTKEESTRIYSDE